MPTTLAKPKTGTAAGGKLGLAGDTYKIKAARMLTRFWSPLADETGDGDTEPQFQNNGYLYGRVSFNGWLISGSTVGIASIAAGTSLSVAVTVQTGHTFTGTLKVESITVDWRKTATNVPLSISGVFDGTITEAVA